MRRLVADGERPISSASSPDRHRAAVGQDVQRGELGEPEPKLPELAGEPDDQLAPERPAHRDALAELADVLEPAAGRQDRGGQVRLEATGQRAGRGRSARDARDRALFGHRRKRIADAKTHATVHGNRAFATARAPYPAHVHRIAFVFPGQGSQSVGMGQTLAGSSPAAAAVFAAADAALGEPISALAWNGPAERLDLTENAQPALVATSIAILEAAPRGGSPPPGLELPGAGLRGRSLDGPVHRDGRRRRPRTWPTPSASSASAAG